MNARGLEREGALPDQGEDAVCELGGRWVDAFNRRDGDALIGLAHAEIEFHPTLLAGARRSYSGHAGLRRWLADVVATNLQHSVEASVVRRSAAGDLVISGTIMVGEEGVSPFSMRFRLKDGKFIEAWAYLSDEALLSSLGRLDPE